METLTQKSQMLTIESLGLPPVLSLEEAMEKLLPVSRQTLYDLMGAGLIVSFKLTSGKGKSGRRGLLTQSVLDYLNKSIEASAPVKRPKPPKRRAVPA